MFLCYNCCMQKVNFQKETEKILDGIKTEGRKPTLLLHSCCGPCSSYVLKYLWEHFDIAVYFFNPNIYPREEYVKRLDTQKQLLDEMGGGIKLYDGGYDRSSFLAAAKGTETIPEGGERCVKCFLLRLEQTAKKAAELGAEYFGTTLTVSPHKNAAAINGIGAALQEKYGVKFLFSDFKKKEGYKQSALLSKKYGLYRQEYCGCEFSLAGKEE